MDARRPTVLEQELIDGSVDEVDLHAVDGTPLQVPTPERLRWYPEPA